MLETLREHPVRILTIVFAVLILSVVSFLILRPSAREANPSPETYPVRGIDISAHNGEIDFNILARSAEFVYIKATEGVTWNDRVFERNYSLARESGLKVGVYHYFRFDRSGLSQGINLYNALWNKTVDLPVAIDVEDSGNASGVPVDTIVARLHDMVDYLEKHEIDVMFYTNKKGYRRYLESDFSSYPLWICSFTTPSDDIKWLFWQYTHSGKVEGIVGDVDMSVFNGSLIRFRKSAANQSWR